MSPARVVGSSPHLPSSFAGRVEVLAIESDALRGNPLGDPSLRELITYVPPGASPSELPWLVILCGFTGRPHAYLETHPWRLGVVPQLDRMIQAGELPPAVLLLPDAFTRWGGSQYVDSPAVGRYATHVTEELLPLAREHLGLAPDRGGVLGKSSGGFGALHLAMRTPGLFRACASISGDCGFDALFPAEFLACLRGLQAHDGDPRAFLRTFDEAPSFSAMSGDGHAILNVLAMAACYSPNPESPLGFDLPFDLTTGELVEPVWRRWLAFDPLEAVGAHAGSLKELAWLHVECGLADEFHLQWGARRLSRRLKELGIAHSHEEHAGGHRGIDHRIVEVARRMAAALTS